MYAKKNSKNPDPEYYNREVKRLKVKVRKAYNTRKFGQHYQADVNRLSKELLVAKKKAQEAFLRLVLQKEGRCWTEFCMLNDLREIEKIFR
jgi:succinate dehydrogenase/fumarate reductase flavoprotein subunit